MKKITKRTSLLTALALAVAILPAAAFAVEASREPSLSIEEWEAALSAECAKYQIEYAVLDYDPDLPLTQEMLDASLDQVRLYAESLQVRPVGGEAAPGESASPEGVAAPQAVLVDKTVKGVFEISNLYGIAAMEASADLQIDLANGNITNVYRTDAYQKGLFVNFVSWTTTRITATENSPKMGFLTLRVQGRVTFSYADPVTGVTSGYTSDADQTLQIDCR